MKKLSKYLLIAFLALCSTSGVLGDWNATFYVDALEGNDYCGYPTYTGWVTCSIVGGEFDQTDWEGYQVYTFQLNAPNSGTVWGYVNVENQSDPPQVCDGSNSETWLSPPNPAEIRISVTPSK